MNIPLSDLMNKYGSDKDVNGYCQLYHTLFSPFRKESFTFLEIGIGTLIEGVPSSMVGYSQKGYAPGGSLRGWRDFFPNANIVGVDIQKDCMFEEDRIKTYLCSSSDTKASSSLMSTLPSPKVIIDDGSHYYMDQLYTLRNFLPYLEDGGIYIIEDIVTNSPISANPSILEDELFSILGYQPPYFFVGKKYNQCVIMKCPLPSRRVEPQYRNW